MGNLNFLLSNASFLLAAITVFLHQSSLSSALHSPLNVRADVVNGTDFVIISWDFQSGAAYSKVYFRSYIDIPSIKGHSTSAAGPSKPFCDGAKCSFCISNLNNRNRSCHAFNPGYTFSFAIQLDFEMFVSYKVGACSRNESSTCLDSMWKNYTIPPGAPSSVRSVQARPLSSKSVEVTWTAPEQSRGTIEAYSVVYKMSEEKEQHRTFYTDFHKENKAKLIGLQANTKYFIWVLASTRSKEGERSNVTSVTTYENECASSPCQQMKRCKVTTDSYECDCLENWEGKNCHKPKGYTIDEDKCLLHSFVSFDANMTLVACVEKCNADYRCKSFEFGCGYGNDTVCLNNLYLRGLGVCKLRSEGKGSYHQLQRCTYDYYEKDASKGNAATVLPLALLLSLSVMLSVVI